MKSPLNFAVCAFISLVVALPVRAEEKAVGKAREILQLWLDGKDDAFVARGTAALQENFKPAKAKEVREQLEAQYGAYQGELGVTCESGVKGDRVSFRLRFERMILKLTIGLEPDGKLAAFLITGVESVEGWKPPKYDQPDRYTEKKVTIQTGKYKMPGILTLPKDGERVPGVVLVHGSGPHDPDETILVNKPFKDIAIGLACRGIAVLRYEKRTHKYGADMQAADITLEAESIDDALSAAEVMRKDPRIDPRRVIVLGHSLGGMVAPLIAERDPKLAGIIIMAGTTRPLLEVMEEQIAYMIGLDGSVSKEEQKKLDEVKQAAAAIRKGILDDPKAAGLGAPPAYFVRFEKLGNLEAAQKLKCPILIIQGGRDYQVTMKSFNLWKKGLGSRPNVTYKLYERLNHLMMTGDGPPGPNDYDKAKHVSKKLISDMAEWIHTLPEKST